MKIAPSRLTRKGTHELETLLIHFLVNRIRHIRGAGRRFLNQPGGLPLRIVA